MSQNYNSIFKKFVATFACFICITLWHLPITPTLIIWISLNILNSFIEAWGKALAGTKLWSGLRSKLSRASYLRLLALLGLPLFILSIISNLFFLSSNEKVGHEFIKRILENTHNYTIFLILTLYCGANVSLDYNKVVVSTTDLAHAHGLSSTKKDETDKSLLSRLKKKE